MCRERDGLIHQRLCIETDLNAEGAWTPGLPDFSIHQKYTKCTKVFQMSKNIPNGHKIIQMDIK
jgi:hypothetical protein